MKLVAIGTAFLITVCSNVSAMPLESELKASKLVEQLASQSFRIRENASRELIALGADAKKALESGTRSADPEVADRCRRLLPLAYEFYVLNLLKSYAQQPTPALHDELPGARRWKTIAGESEESTRLYVEMITSHRAVLLEAVNKPESVTDLQRKFVQELVQQIRPASGEAVRSDILTRTQLATFLFLSTDPRYNHNQIENGIGGYLPVSTILNQGLWPTLLHGKDSSPAFRRLFVEFVATQTNTIILRRALQLAISAEVKEVIPAAVRIAQNTNTAGSIRAYALTALVKLGSKDDLKTLMPFMNDETVVATVTFNGERKQVEMRDVALGVALILCDQTMTDYGFDRNPPTYASSTSTVSYIYFSMQSSEKRVEGLRRWKDYTAKKQPEK